LFLAWLLLCSLFFDTTTLALESPFSHYSALSQHF
jgi:hypothetical protein